MVKIARQREGVLSALPWWSWLFAVNLLLVLATVAHHKLVLNHSIHFYLRQIDLAIEMNLAAWWSGVLLFGLGLLAYEIFSSREERAKLAWLLLAIAFTCLSIDEIGSIHERIEDWLIDSPLLAAIDPYVPIAITGLLLIPYPLLALFRHQRTRKTAWLLLIGFLLFSSIALQERLEGSVDWGDWWSLRLGLEEGTELLGMFFCYGAMVNHTWCGHAPSGLSGVLPNPLRMKAVPILVGAGLAIHLALMAFQMSQYEQAFSEHLLVWYPLALSVLLSLSAFWQYRRSSEKGSFETRAWRLLAVYCLLSSAILPYVIPLTTDKADAFFSAYVYPFYVLQWLIAIALLLLQKSLSISSTKFLTLAAMSLLVAVSGCYWLTDPWLTEGSGSLIRYGLPGMFTFLLFYLFFENAFGYGKAS